MQFSIIPLLSLAASAFAQSAVVGFDPPAANVLQVGVPAVYKYHAPGPVTISLRQGPSTNLGAPTVLASGATGGSFTFTPTVGGSNFALQITSGSQTNYFGPIQVNGGSASSSAVSVSSHVATSYGGNTKIPSSSTTAPVVVHTPAPGVIAPVRTNSTSSAAAPSGSSNPAPYPIPVPVPARNSTTPKTSSPSQTGSSNPATTSTPASGAAQLGSSLALVMAVFAGLAYLN